MHISSPHATARSIQSSWRHDRFLVAQSLRMIHSEIIDSRASLRRGCRNVAGCGYDPVGAVIVLWYDSQGMTGHYWHQGIRATHAGPVASFPHTDLSFDDARRTCSGNRLGRGASGENSPLGGFGGLWFFWFKMNRTATLGAAFLSRSPRTHTLPPI